ncbi:MAG: hypothetical protein HUJ56_04200 [Erysipelotrichaceae bacterium]|nr:hypothetical protein [Erysipelotrichaceae bacterium]
MTPFEFVQQVIFRQEGVILDLWPQDDKYKEIIMAVNQEIPQLQFQEDWTWLRDRLILGKVHGHHCHEIPEFELPDHVYAICTKQGDDVRFYHLDPHGQLDEHHFESCTFKSDVQGKQAKDPYYYRRFPKLHAQVIGRTLTFNTPLPHHLTHKVIVCDYLKKLKTLHICSDKCNEEISKIKKERKDSNWELSKISSWTLDDYLLCPHIEKDVCPEIPDANLYLVVKTAHQRAMLSPPAQSLVQPLQDEHQKILSKMRTYNENQNEPDKIDFTTFSYLDVF